MKPSEQIPLNLSSSSAYEREDFFVSESNNAAVSWVDKWPNWNAPAFVIIGSPASGKTHLMKVWQRGAKAIEISLNDIEKAPEVMLHNVNKNMAIDDIHLIAGNRDKENALFHLYNIAKENRGSLLTTSEKPIKDCGFTLPDLNSRLMAAPAATILPPDEELMSIMLAKIFSDKQLFVSEDVIKYIIPRIERSFKAVRELADKIDYQSLTEKKSVTIPLVKSIIEG